MQACTWGHRLLWTTLQQQRRQASHTCWCAWCAHPRPVLVPEGRGCAPDNLTANTPRYNTHTHTRKHTHTQTHTDTHTHTQTHTQSVVNYEVTPPEGLCHWAVALADEEAANLLHELPAAVGWLERAMRQKGAKVLVHCHAGVCVCVLWMWVCVCVCALLRLA
jgi:hypothetical protein